MALVLCFGFSFAFFLSILLGILLPFAGFVTAAFALSKGEERIGKAGVVIAGIALVLPIIFVAVAIIFPGVSSTMVIMNM
ncbi:MAG: hypothetical protein FWC93_07480 [Defluviitaleaceae bacterium]|nr:hypothetical protein [Defluviitaleaceae bacterium]